MSFLNMIVAYVCSYGSLCLVFGRLYPICGVSQGQRHICGRWHKLNEIGVVGHIDCICERLEIVDIYGADGSEA